MTTAVAVTSLTQLEDTTYTDDGLRGTTSELGVPRPSSWAGEQVLLSLLTSISILGFIANIVMLISLVVYQKTAKKTVNVFICNQTVLDLVSTSSMAVKIPMVMAGYLKTKTGVLRISRRSY